MKGRQIDLERVTSAMMALAALVPAVRRIREAWAQGRYLAALDAFARLRIALDELEEEVRAGAVAAGVDPSSVAAALREDDNDR